MNHIDLHRIDLNLLVVFETLMSERHVGRAAHRLNLTQSAVSHALGRLRLLFEDPLFVRHPKGIEPTKRSLALGANIADILNRTRSVLASSPIFDPSHSHRFTIGQTDGSVAILVALMERLRIMAPNIELHVRPVDTRAVITAIDRQDLDLALGVMAQSQSPTRILQIPIFEIPYVGIARRGHRVLGIKPLSAEAFATLPHLALSPRGEPTNRIDELLEEMGLKRNIALTIPHFLAAPPIVSRTDLVAIIDKAIARLFATDKRLAIFQLPVKLRPLTIDMLVAAARAEESALRWLREQVVQAASGLERITNKLDRRS
jgi:DNA-binding transcriptional LysR family regulator